MRILLIDIDSLRFDHLGCGGYHRPTSPTIDHLAETGTVLTQCFATDVPCCPSRSSLFSGQYGIKTGCVNHSGSCATPWSDSQRGFIDARDHRTLPACLRDHGHRTALISAFPSRHSAWHSLAGFSEWHDTGKRGHEVANSVAENATAWLDRHALEADWFCHVTFWDAHTPYRTPAAYGDPFTDNPPPAWPNAATIERHAQSTGIRSARDSSWSKSQAGPRQPAEITDRTSFQQLINGYDTGIRIIDDHINGLLERLDKLGVREETTVIITADHGEDFGEFGAYASHCFCGPSVARVPMILNGPVIPQCRLTGLHQHFDIGATLLDLAGIDIPNTWDAQSFRSALEGDPDDGRQSVTSSMLAQGIQRAVYWREPGQQAPFGYIKTWNDLGHGLSDECIIESQDHAGQYPQDQHPLLDKGRNLLENWTKKQLATSEHPDPLTVVQHEGTDTTQQLLSKTYALRLARTGRVLPDPLS